jgi:hypothetical protein
MKNCPISQAELNILYKNNEIIGVSHVKGSWVVRGHEMIVFHIIG